MPYLSIERLKSLSAQAQSGLLLALATLIPFTQIQGGHTQYTSLCIILLSANWLFSFQWKEKVQRLRRNNIVIWLLLPFLYYLIGMLWTSDWEEGARLITLKLSLLAFPLIIFSSNTSPRTVTDALLTLTASTLAAMLLTFRNGFAFLTNRPYFLNNAEEFIVMHRPYFGLLSAFCVLIMLSRLRLKAPIYKNALLTATIAAVLAFMWFISAKMAMLSLGLALFGALLLLLKGAGKGLVSLILLVISVAGAYGVITFVPSIHTAISRVLSGVTIAPAGQTYSPLFSIDSRMMIWQFYGRTISAQHALPFGVGTGDVHKTMQAVYRLEGPFWEGEMYNAHNQFLEETLRLGIPGALLIFLLFAVPGYWAFRQNKVLPFAVCLLILSAMLTEVVLDRITGLVFCAFVNTLFAWQLACNRSPRKQTEIQNT